ncbi:MAG: HPF/RaiA family ribosome-associated protein [Gammaproteobacteria bacterium]|jgi:ribosomal subunit interface protein
MTLKADITFHGMDSSEAMRTNIIKYVEKIARLAPEIISCKVVVEPEEKGHQKGNRFTTRVHVTLPGAEFEAGRQQSNEDAYVAIRDAFDAMRRQLEEHVGRRQDEVRRSV